MKKFNSVYVEFEPVSGVVWDHMRRELQDVIRSYGIQLITWETGLVDVPNHEDNQIDIFGSMD